MVVIGGLLYSGKCGCIRAKCCIQAKVVVFGQGCCIRAKLLLFGQKWL